MVYAYSQANLHLSRRHDAHMPKVLLIDDDDHVRSAVKIALEANGFEVMAVEGGRRALREFDDSPFDLAIVDVFMLEMDGATVIKALRDRAPRLPIVVMSGGGYAETMLDIFNASAAFPSVVCLKKPFQPSALKRAIDQAIQAFQA